MKICLIRLDKIGDLVSTLPVDQIPELTGHEVRWVIAEGLGFLPKQASPHREYLELPLDRPQEAQKKLHQYLKEQKPDLAILFYGPWWVAKVLWQARVPRRFGRRSQWYSYVFMNEGLRQKRSLGEKHEADYNLELLLTAVHGTEALSEADGGRSAPILSLTAPTLRHLFEKYQIRSHQYVVVHPGMAGSALNWPIDHYINLIDKLKIDSEVLLTGTAQDDAWLGPISQHFAQDPRVQSLRGLLSMSELLFILQNASAVIGPSTGVIHLAASLGTRTVGLYSPVLSQHPRRWAPRGHAARYLMPTFPEGTPESRMSLDSITPDQVMSCLNL